MQSYTLKLDDEQVAPILFQLERKGWQWGIDFEIAWHNVIFLSDLLFVEFMFKNEKYSDLFALMYYDSIVKK